MNFDDTYLYNKETGKINFDYAFNCFMTVKDVYDVKDAQSDMSDIYRLINSYPLNFVKISEKSMELKKKYIFYVILTNLFNEKYSLLASNNDKSDDKNQLEMFYRYIPVFVLAKKGLSKIFDNYLKQAHVQFESEGLSNA